MDSPAVDVWPAPLEPLPRGPHSLPRDVVVSSQRARIVRGLIEVVAEKGYVATTVADVIGRAGVSRTTFYQQFKDKEDCFLLAYQNGADAQFRKVVEAVETTTDPLEQIRRNLRAYLGELVAFPASARAFLLEVAAAGPGALAIRDGVRLRYAPSRCSLHGDDPPSGKRSGGSPVINILVLYTSGKPPETPHSEVAVPLAEVRSRGLDDHEVSRCPTPRRGGIALLAKTPGGTLQRRPTPSSRAAGATPTGWSPSAGSSPHRTRPCWISAPARAA